MSTCVLKSAFTPGGGGGGGYFKIVPDAFRVKEQEL